MDTDREFKGLIEYVMHWHSIDGIKPKNEVKFLTEFVNLLNGYPDEREVQFDGEGAYFGKQITLMPFSYFGETHKALQFEVAYSINSISIYTKRHQGFWVPEFVNLTKKDVGFQILHDELMCFLKGVFGVQ